MWLRFLTISIVLLLTIPRGIAQENEREGGIIGTGIVDVGIVGTITQLGSIYVNGQHIKIDATLPVSDAVSLDFAHELRPGHTVAVMVQQRDDEWHAVHIRQILSLVGPIETVDRQSITILGTRVELGDLSFEFDEGDWVAISGLWQGSHVIASLIEPVPETLQQARISGTYWGMDVDKKIEIGTTKISGIEVQHLEIGDAVRVFGRPSSDGIEANRLEVHLFDDTISVVQVEGYFSKPRPDGLYTVLGSGLVSYTDQLDMFDVKGSVILCGVNDPLRKNEGATLSPTTLKQLGCK